MPALTRRSSSFPAFSPVLDESDGFSTLMRRMFNDPVASLGRSVIWSPTVEIRETTDEIRLTAELPGMSDDDITLTLENGVLSIAGEKKSEFEERDEDERFLLTERFYGAFQRSFALPTSVDADKIKAGFDHGVLTITLPKTAQAKGRVIPVKSKAK
jgi:HSP20 family protein